MQPERRLPLIIACALFIENMDSTAIATALPAIAADFGTSPIALKLALSRPGSVERLVLAVTSGGVPVADLGGADWRSDYFTAFPNAARWIADPVCDLSSRIPMVKARTLLLWGGADPLSPVTVGERLLTLLPNARLRVFPDAGHDLAQTHVDAVAAEIGKHLIDDASASPR